ncbi:MAG: hypothetical protein WA175_01580 [Candidatus Acidiferrales bacterium]
MMDVHIGKHKPGARNPHEALSTGLYSGALLTLVMLASLVVADRIPGIERYALERNGISYGLFLAVMLYPVCRFLNRPLQMFAAGMTGWVMFAAAYDLAGIYFRNLFQVLRTPFEALVEGTIVYGLCAVVSWVGTMAIHARHHAIAPSRRRPDDAVPHQH